MTKATEPRAPYFYSCGCSHNKVKLGRCDIYDEQGRPRADHSEGLTCSTDDPTLVTDAKKIN